MPVPLAVPHFPAASVCAVVADASDSLLCRGLTARGIRVLPVTPDLRLAPPVRCHADMLCHHMGGEKILLLPGQDSLASLLKKEGLLPEFLIGCRVDAGYPADVPLNGARLGAFLVGNPDTLAARLLQVYGERGITLIPVRQGYTKCALCMVRPGAVITEDLGVARACEKAGVEVLRIRAGGVLLPGYPYGFLGGTCGLLAPDLLGFCGELSTHPDADLIHRFLERHGVRPVSLCAGPLRDIGGILPLLEEESTKKPV